MNRRTSSRRTPSSPRSLYAERIDASILEHGHAVVAVGYGECSIPGCQCEDRAAHPWSYSVGLARLAQPELVVLGLTLEAAHFVIDAVARRRATGDIPPPDTPFEVDGVAVKIVDVPDEWFLTDPDRMAVWLDEVERRTGAWALPPVQQIVWADAEGRFPDDPSCLPEVARQQPVLRDDPFSVPHRSRRELRRARHRRPSRTDRLAG
ncbi:MAG: DUF4262 domain-containing protein [Ilumatobacteraceae bacterium]